MAKMQQEAAAFRPVTFHRTAPPSEEALIWELEMTSARGTPSGARTGIQGTGRGNGPDLFPVLDALRMQTGKSGALGALAQSVCATEDFALVVAAPAELLDRAIGGAGIGDLARIACAFEVPRGALWLESSAGGRPFGIWLRKLVLEPMLMRRVDMVGRRLKCAPVGLARTSDPADIDSDWTAIRTGGTRPDREVDRRWASSLYAATSLVALEPGIDCGAAEPSYAPLCRDLIRAAVSVSPLSPIEQSRPTGTCWSVSA